MDAANPGDPKLRQRPLQKTPRTARSQTGFAEAQLELPEPDLQRFWTAESEVRKLPQVLPDMKARPSSAGAAWLQHHVFAQNGTAGQPIDVWQTARGA